MATVLFITANPNEESSSFSLSVGRSFIEEYRTINPGDKIVELDLYSNYIPLIDRNVLSAWNSLRAGTPFTDLTEEQQQKVGRIDQLTDQFIHADKYVLVTPMWNLSIPPLMKAYIDTVVIAGKSFQYTPTGPVGLLTGKKGIHIQARGGFYSGELSSLEFGDSYLKAILGFVGIQMLDTIVAEGMAYDPAQAEDIKNGAIALARDAAKVLAAG